MKKKQKKKKKNENKWLLEYDEDHNSRFFIDRDMYRVEQ